MDTRQLKYIVEIAASGSISKASEKLFISQSGLNQQLMRIEKDLGAELFQRDTHHLKITEAGDIFLNFAKDVLNREELMHAMISDVIDGNVGEIRLNIAMEQGIELFSRIFADFHRKYPQVEIKLEDHIVYDQYKRLADGLLDIGMVMIKSREIKDIEYVHLAYERFLLGIPATHPLARLYVPTEDGDYPEIDLSLCKDEPFSLMFSGSTLRQVIDPCFENAGFRPHIMFESRTNHVVALMVTKGICLTILPESQARLYKNICWFRLADHPTWESCLIYPADRPPRKAGRYLIELAVRQGQFISGKSKPVWLPHPDTVS